MLMVKPRSLIFIYKSTLCIAVLPVLIFAVESVPIALFRSLLWVGRKPLNKQQQKQLFKKH